MNRILTKALMKYYNDFFKMTEEEQDVFKLQDHDDLDEKVSAFVYKELGIDKDSNKSADCLLYNSTMLPYRGIGKDSFMLNEFDWNEEILTFETLYDYNKSYHEYQENAFAEDENFPKYKPKELYNRFSSWARVFIDGNFKYLNLLSTQIWLYWKLEEFAIAWIEEQIPHKYVDGKDNGKKTKGGYLWDMRLDAHGLEGWYEQINDFSREWLNKKYDETKSDWDKVFIIDTTNSSDDPNFKDDPSLDYIFGSMEVLKHLTFKNFVNDCNKVKGDVSELMAYKESALIELQGALESAFEEIKKTSPNVVKLKKKMKVIMTDEALADLSNLEE